MNERSSILFLRCVTFLGLALAIVGCTRTPAMPTPPPITVSVSKPVERKISDYSDFVGRTSAVQSVSVRSRVWGFLEKINFKEGALVKKDDVLFEIDPRPYQALVNQAKADLESKEAMAVKMEAVYKRTEVLVRTNAASREDLDNSKGDWLVAKANIAVSKASLNSAELNLGFTKVKAEIDGRASNYNVTLGNIVQSVDQGGGTLLTTIVSVDPMYAYFDVDERTVLRVRELIREGKAKSVRDTSEHLPLLLSLATDVGFPHKGEFDFVDNQVNAGTGTLRARGIFDNKTEYLVPGLFVRVRVPIGLPRDAFLVTDRAVDSDQGQKILYLVDEKNEVVVRAVELGALHDGLREVTTGLNGGERIVVNGLQQIRPGALVDPKEIDMPVNPAFAKAQASKK